MMMPTSDDGPARTPCYYDPGPFDVLLCRTGGPEFWYATQEAADMCGRCPVRRKCHAENRREAWVEPVRLELRRRDAAAAAPTRAVSR